MAAELLVAPFENLFEPLVVVVVWEAYSLVHLAEAEKERQRKKDVVWGEKEDQVEDSIGFSSAPNNL